MQNAKPVSGEKQEADDAWNCQVLARYETSQSRRERNKEEVQRPNSQYAAQVKRGYIEYSPLFLFPQQKLSDEVSTEHKKQIDSERPAQDKVLE